MKPILHVGNQNYSSWSLRPWLALTWGHIEFDLRVIPMGGVGYGERRMPAVVALSKAGTVPALQLSPRPGGGDVISDSLAICEWAAEQTPSLWPSDPVARAYARSAACEMHSGFSAMRQSLSCNIRRRAGSRTLNDATTRDVARLVELWTELRSRFSGGARYLFGADPTIADAFFTPVATRFRTYEVALPSTAQEYADALLTNDAFLKWEAAAIAEPHTMKMFDDA